MKRDNWWINRKKTYSNPLLRWRIQCHSKSPKKIGGLTCWQSLRFVIDNMALLRVLFCRCLSIFFGQIHGFPICTNITLNTCLVFFPRLFLRADLVAHLNCFVSDFMGIGMNLWYILNAFDGVIISDVANQWCSIQISAISLSYWIPTNYIGMHKYW